MFLKALQHDQVPGKALRKTNVTTAPYESKKQKKICQQLERLIQLGATTKRMYNDLWRLPGATQLVREVSDMS